METLVLDQSYQPVGRVTWQRAITLLFMGKIEIVSEYEDREIRSVTFSMKMPSVVRFVNAVRRRKQAVRFSRQNIYIRDSGRCQYCGQHVEMHDSTYDHVVPRSQGGKTCWENIVIACGGNGGCNSKKGNRTPAQAGMKLLKVPVRPRQLPTRVTLTWSKSMPLTWRQFFTDQAYWMGALDTDEEL